MLMKTPLSGRHHLSDYRQSRHHETARTQALDDTRGYELPHLLGDPAGERADQEDGDGAVVHRLATVEITQLSVDWDHRRRGEHVADHYPRLIGEVAELGCDGRQSDRHDRRVDDGHDVADHQGSDDRHDLAPRQLEIEVCVDCVAGQAGPPGFPNAARRA
jgi:hypothetical protein